MLFIFSVTRVNGKLFKISKVVTDIIYLNYEYLYLCYNTKENSVEILIQINLEQ